MASQPAYFSSAPKWPPMWPLATRSTGTDVGKMVVTDVRPPQGVPVPVRGPTARMILLAGSNEPVPAGTSSQRTR